MYLATGSTQALLQIPFRIEQSTISRIFRETIAVLYKVLNDEYLRFPENKNDWLEISNEFFKTWGFPNCIGAIDGKHCKIKEMKKFGSNYWCYKGTYSFIPMAIADAHYRFIYADVGVNGRMGDACLWANSDLKTAIESKTVNIPEPSYLPGTQIVSSFTLISDDAFPLTSYMLKPFSHMNLSEDQVNFNYVLSKNRRVVENAFGILANRFQVLFNTIFRAPKPAIEIVLACVCLHNFLRTDNIRNKTDYDILTDEHINRVIEENYEKLHIVRSRRTNKNAIEIRNTLMKYFRQFKETLVKKGNLYK